MVTVVSPRHGPTECCGALIYTVTHKGTFCAECGRRVYLWNGLLETPERNEELRQKMLESQEPDWIPEHYRPCKQPAAHGFRSAESRVRCDEPSHH